MALETGTYISDLVSTNPVSSDNISQGDDHIRLLKSTIKATFPNITGAVTPTHTDLNKLTSSGSPQFSTIELGHASDTTITRSAAGVIAVEGGVVPKENRANTFTAAQIISVTDNTNAALRITQLGTGYALLVEDSANPDSTPFVVDASGNVGIGTTAAAGVRLAVNGNTPAAGKLSAVGDSGGISLALSDNVNNSVYITHQSPNAVIGTDAGGGFGIASNGFTERLRVDSSGNILNVSSGGLGYGTGSGGTVTQATSKGTAVTLNKTNGQIVMNGANLNAGATVGFVLNNSTLALNDTCIVSGRGATWGWDNYHIWGVVTAGALYVYVKNISASNLAEGVQINFAIIKAVTS